MAQLKRHESVTSKADSYLSDLAKDLSSLNKYPTLLKLFAKFNTALQFRRDRAGRKGGGVAVYVSGVAVYVSSQMSAIV